jgi:hypothetical protein
MNKEEEKLSAGRKIVTLATIRFRLRFWTGFDSFEEAVKAMQERIGKLKV